MITLDEFNLAKKQILSPNTHYNGNNNVNNNVNNNGNTNLNRNTGGGGIISSLLNTINGVVGGGGGDQSDGLIQKGIKTAFNTAIFPAKMILNVAKKLLSTVGTNISTNIDYSTNEVNDVAKELNNDIKNNLNNNANLRNNSMNNITPGSKGGGDIGCIDQLNVVCNNCTDPKQLLELHNGIITKLKKSPKGYFSNDINTKINSLFFLSEQTGGNRRKCNSIKKKLKKYKKKTKRYN